MEGDVADIIELLANPVTCTDTDLVSLRNRNGRRYLQVEIEQEILSHLATSELVYIAHTLGLPGQLKDPRCRFRGHGRVDELLYIFPGKTPANTGDDHCYQSGRDRIQPGQARHGAQGPGKNNNG